MNKMSAESMFAAVATFFFVAIFSLISIYSAAQTVTDFKGGYVFQEKGSAKAAYVKKVASYFGAKTSNSKKEDPVKGFYIKNDSKDSLGVFVAVSDSDLTINGVPATPEKLYNVITTKGKEAKTIADGKAAIKAAKAEATAIKKAAAEKKRQEAAAKKAECAAKAAAKKAEKAASTVLN